MRKCANVRMKLGIASCLTRYPRYPVNQSTRSTSSIGQPVTQSIRQKHNPRISPTPHSRIPPFPHFPTRIRAFLYFSVKPFSYPAAAGRRLRVATASRR